MTQLPNYNSPRALEEFLKAFDFGMQKKFGQNFLVNETIREFLIKALELDAAMSVWEIGPGLGAMTYRLVESGVDLTAFEIDRGFAGLLRTFFAEDSNFNLIEGDALKTWKEALKSQGKPDRFFGNLPYNVGARLIGDTIAENVIFDRMVVTVQKEVGQRMAARPSTSAYSSFSVLCQSRYNVKVLRDISPSAFWPQPNVKSAAVLLTKKESDECSNPKLFVSLLRGLFSARRKTIRNTCKSWLSSHAQESLRNLDVESVLSSAGLSPDLRPENLSVEDFIKLTEIFDTILKG